MKKDFFKLGLSVGIFLTAVIVVCAATRFFFTQSITTDINKKTIFQFDLDTGLDAVNGSEIGPGDSFSVTPIIYNDATEAMYVFVVIQMPMVDDKPLYTFDIDEDWVLVEESEGGFVYAYGASEMISLSPGERTSALTEEMTMQPISNAEYAWIGDINITITGYAIGTDDTDSNPEEAWNWCRSLGNIE